MDARTPLGEHSGRDRNDNRLAHVAFRLWQLEIAAVVVLVTAWFITLGPVPAILALVTAKHVLVALLMIRIEHGARRRLCAQPADSTPPEVWDPEW